MRKNYVTSSSQNHPRDAELLNKPIENYAQVKRIYTVRVPPTPLTPAAVHRALSHLMDHKAHATVSGDDP
jgi:hypothetical protein